MELSARIISLVEMAVYVILNPLSNVLAWSIGLAVILAALITWLLARR